MNGVFFLLGVCFLTPLVEGGQNFSTTDLNNLTNVISLTEQNVDEKIASKHHFVLFFEAG